MSHVRGRIVPVLLAGGLLVGAANLGAYAATGKPLLAGKANTAGKTTTIKNTGNSPVLKLKGKKTKAPLKVNSKTRVKKLNADLLDGLHASALETKSYGFELTASAVTDNFIHFALPGLPPGKYLVDFNVTAAVTGTATELGCFVVTGSGPGLDVAAVTLGTESGGGWFINGGGFVDTSTTTYRFACQRTGGTDASIPLSPSAKSYVVFTRVDDVAAFTGVAGTGATAPRPFG